MQSEKSGIFENAVKNIVIFGGGTYGRNVFDVLHYLAIPAYAVTDNHHSDIAWLKSTGIPYIAPQKLQRIENLLVIIAMKNDIEEVRAQLHDFRISDEHIMSYADVMNRLGVKLAEEESEKISHHLTDYYDDAALQVLFDNQIYTMQRFGGISRYYYELMHGITEHSNVQADFCNCFCKSEFDFSTIAPQYRYYHETRGDLPLAAVTFTSQKLLHDLTQNRTYDIYHPSYYQDFHITAAKHLIVTVHDMIYELILHQEEMDGGKRSLLERADAVIAVSENTKKDLVSYYHYDPAKVFVIYEAASVPQNPGAKAVIPEKYILYVGQRGGYKNFEGLLRAFAQSTYRNDVILVAYGGGNFSDGELRMIDELGLSENVRHITGDMQLMANLYAYAEAFIYPSQYEGFGIPILEAMHYGAPVLTADVSSMPEVGGNAAVYFNPYDIESMKNAIDRVLENSELRAHLSKLSIEREKLFSWEKCARQTLKLYHMVAGK